LQRRNGLLAAVSAYVVWGLLPVYWKQIDHLPAQEILGHRIVWLLVTMLLIQMVRRRWDWLARLLRQPAALIPYLGTAALLGLNWFTYIWAINNARIVESSLGYVINPLVNVMLGVIFLRERLRLGQWSAILLATGGVVYLTADYGRLPWIAVTLALTFGFYGLIRKSASLQAIDGMTVEAALMFSPALFYLLRLESVGAGTLGHTTLRVNLLLVMAGVITAIPLIAFNYGAKRITLTAIGILQYIAPTLQFLLGVWAYREPFSPTQLLGFSIIWLALAVYTVEGIWFRRKQQQLALAMADVVGR